MKKLSKISIPTLCILPFLAAIFLQFGALYGIAHADDGGGIGSAVMFLFTAIKDHASTAVIVMYAFKILTSHETYGLLGKIGLKGKALQLTVAVLTTLGFCAQAWAKGSSIPQALIEGFFTAGGAMLIYDASKAATTEVAAQTAAPMIVAAVPVDFPAKKD